MSGCIQAAMQQNTITSYQHLFIGLIVDDSIAITSNTATIEWNTYTNLDQSQFNQYIIKLKKRYTEENFETPLILLTTSTSYDLTDLEVAMDYEVWVKVDTIDFGQSEWSDSLYFSTPATSDSQDADIQQVIDEIVRFYYFRYPNNGPEYALLEYIH